MRSRRWLATLSALALAGSLSFVHGAPRAYAAAPSNDNFANAIPISGASGSTTGTNLDATLESDEPGNSMSASVWWSWIAPSTGTFMFQTCGSDFTTRMYIQTGSALNDLTWVANQAANCYSDGNAFQNGGYTVNATQGTTYYISVGGVPSWPNPGMMGNIDLKWWPQQIPANDSIDTPGVLTGNSGHIAATNRFATTATDTTVDNQVWWTWTPSSDGTYLFDTCGSSFDTALRPFTMSGGILSDPLFVNDGSCENQSSGTFTATAGTTYYIEVGATNLPQIGDISLNWRPAAAPGNDNLADAVPITGASGSITGNNQLATLETDEPTATTNSVWWTWTAPSNGTVIFDTCGSDFSTSLGVYTGTDMASLTAVASEDNGSCLDTQSMTMFTATNGAVYDIRVTADGGDGGNVSLHWQMGSAPANDDFTNASALVGSGGTLTGSNLFATTQAGEPSPASGGSNSVWFDWTAPDNVPVSFDTCGSPIQATGLSVYTGSTLGALTLVGSDYASGYCGAQARVAFTPVPQTTYHVALGAWGNTMGSYVLHWPSSVTTLHAPLVTLSPTSQTVSSGDLAEFLAEATGNPTPTVQWQVLPSGGTWTDIPGETNTSLSLTAEYSMNGNQYRAEFSNTYGTADSDPATLMVNPIPPAIITQPESQAVLAGDAATFSTVVSGDPTPAVQWYSLPPGGSWGTISGATDFDYTTPAATDAMSGTQYKAVFTNPGGGVTSDIVTLTVFNLPAAPINAAASAAPPSKGKMSVTLTWTDQNDGGSAIIDHHINVYKYTAPTKNKAAKYTFASDIDTMSTSTTHTFDVKAGSYVFTVQAANEHGTGPESDYSNPVSR